MEIIFHEYGLQLRLEGDDQLVLNVLCGRIGEYGVEFPLSESEREGYKLGGDAYLKSLAAEVRERPEMFAIRGRSC